MPQSAPAGSHARFARVVSGVDPELVDALGGDSGAAQGAELTRRAEKALAAIVAVVTSEEVASSSIELWLVLRGSEVAVAPRLAAMIGERVPDGMSVTVQPLGVGDDLGGALGDRAEVFSSGLAGGSAVRHVPVFVNGACGAPDVRRALAALADAWGLPVLLVDGDSVDPRHAVGDVTSSLLIEALRFARTKEPTPANDREVLRRGFEGLVARRDGAYGPTVTLDQLLMEDRFIGLPDRYSACADLLRRHGEPELAGQLRTLIDHWLRHRIWSVNQVHEMVLHDEAHSAAVDRNVASLCEPLLGADHPVIGTWDVFVLALCAWLHDWGHASADVGGTMPTDPVEVRQYHGLLTAQRLAQQPEQHGITDDLIPAEHRTTTPQLVAEVALLCSHHQGWTSCSGLPPVEDFRPLPNFSVIGGRGFTDGKADALGLRLSFRQDFDRRLPEGASCGRNVAHLEMLLALLRLADAADIGVHRVPDFVTQHVNRNAELDAMLGRIRLMLKLRASIAARASDQELYQQHDVDDFTRIEAAYYGLMGAVKSRPVWDEEEIGNLIKTGVKGKDLEYWLGAPSEDGSIGHELIRWGSNYALHVVAQAAFYQHHRRVRAVIPTLRRNGEFFELTLHVVPLPIAGDSSEDGKPAKVAERVVKDVLREYARVVVDGLVANDESAPHKAPLAAHLYELNINVHKIHVEVHEPRSAAGEAAAALPARERLLVPYASAPTAPVAWCGWGVDGPALGPLVGGASVGAAGPGGLKGPQPFALTSDGAHAAACVRGVLRIVDVATGSVHCRLRVADECAVLALRRSSDGFTLVLAEGDEVLTAWVPSTGTGSTVERTKESPTPVRAVFVFDVAHLVTADGAVTGPYAGWMVPEQGSRWFDAVSVENRVVWALVPAGSPSEVRIWSGAQAHDPPRLEDVREEKAPEDDGRPVSEIAWVREPRDGVVRLVVMRDGMPATHAVAVET